MKNVDSRLGKDKLVPSEEEGILGYLKKAMRAKNEEELAGAAGYLTTIGIRTPTTPVLLTKINKSS